MTTLQKTVVTAVLAVAVGTGIYEARQASTLRNEVQTLQQRQVRLNEQTQQLRTLQTEFELFKAGNATQNEEIARLQKDNLNLLRLRNEVGQMRDEKKRLVSQLQAAQALSTNNPALDQAVAQQIMRIKVERDIAYSLPLTALDGDGQANSRRTCIQNLGLVFDAKVQWALENKKTVGDVPNENEIAAYLKDGVLPKCAAGGTYVINAIGGFPTCTIPGHALPQP